MKKLLSVVLVLVSLNLYSQSVISSSSPLNIGTTKRESIKLLEEFGMEEATYNLIEGKIDYNYKVVVTDTAIVFKDNECVIFQYYNYEDIVYETRIIFKNESTSTMYFVDLVTSYGFNKTKDVDVFFHPEQAMFLTRLSNSSFALSYAQINNFK
jgi:hypothetical protein